VHDALKKKCSACAEVKSLDDFVKNKLGKLGRHSQCRQCQRDKQKTKYHADLENSRRIKREERRRQRLNHKKKGGVSKDYLKWASQFPDQYDRVKSILERARPDRAKRIALGICLSPQDRWRRFAGSWEGDELLAEALE